MIGDYEKIGWSPDTPKPISSINLQKVDVKLEELDAHLSNMIVLGNAIKGDIGPIGPIGPKGDKGDQGIQGDIGIQGEPGITVPNINGLSTIDSVDLVNDSMIVYDASTSLHKKVSPSTFGIHNHDNKLALDEVTSIKVSNWDTAYANNHPHSNKANLDSINQNLSTTSSPTFEKIYANYAP